MNEIAYKTIWRGQYFWTGVVFALGGYLAEEFSGGKPAFESFMLFGGLFIGVGVERNRNERDLARAELKKQSDSPTANQS